MATRRWTRFLRSDRDEGVTTLEVVIVFPFLLMFIMLVIYACEYEYSTQVALAAAQEGARVAAQSTGPNRAQDGYAAATAYAHRVGGSVMGNVSGGAPTFTFNPALGPNQIPITVSGDMTPMVNFFPLIFGDVTLTISQTVVTLPETFTHG